MAGKGNLGPRLERYVTDLVDTGRYKSRSEVLQEGVRLVEERENRLVALDEAISRGIADAQAGRVRTIDDVERALMDRYQGQATKSDP
ncbi:type II toxin-antitoxin system ParD family antitoxin [Allorhizobium pseudoryzae]|uniref:type II toxin-antitoxin system ParD family antitoxin n=1 Tax=Allorhizobium pseudoryzae TaxID=379684 RepID=UPI003D05D97C